MAVGFAAGSDDDQVVKQSWIKGRAKWAAAQGPLQILGSSIDSYELFCAYSNILIFIIKKSPTFGIE